MQKNVVHMQNVASTGEQIGTFLTQRDSASGEGWDIEVVNPPPTRPNA
jgi:hypothetical protein